MENSAPLLHDTQVQALIHQLAEVEAALEAHLGSQVDAVIDPASGRTFLLRRVWNEMYIAREEMEKCVQDRTAALSAAYEELRASEEQLRTHQEELYAQTQALLASQEEVEAERRRYQELFELAPDGYLVTNLWGIVREANQAAGQTLNVRWDRLVGKPLDLYIAEADKRTFRERLGWLRGGLTGEVRDWDIGLRSRDHEVHSVSVSVTASLSLAGKVTNLHWLIRNITERVSMEARLRQYAERLRILHKTSEAILSAHSAEEVAEAALSQVQHLLPCVQASVSVMDREVQELRRLAVYSAREAGPSKGWCGPLEPVWVHATQELGQRKEVVIADMQALPASSPWTAQLQAAGVNTLVLLPLLSKSQLIGALCLGLEASGHPAPEQMEVARELADALAIGIEHAYLYEEVQRYAGELEWLVRRRTAALQVSEARFRAIFEEAAIGIALVSRNGTLMSTNPALQKMLGYSGRELKGLSLKGLAAADDDGRAATWFKELMAQERGEYTLEQQYVCRDGRVIDVRVNASLVRPGKDRARFAVVMVEDVTERKRTQAVLIQSEKLAMTGRLVASMAHEINNPLQAAIGCLGLAQELLGEGQDASSFIRPAIEELMRAADVVHQMREVHRHPQETHKELTDVNELLEKALRITRKQCPKSSVEVSWEPGENLPVLLLVTNRIEQVVHNLVFNAIDAMPDGGRLRVCTERTLDPHGVRISIADTGVGIPAEQMAHPFDPFQSTKELRVGLGLYVSRGIIQDGGGWIDVQSEVGQGTTVTFWLPAESG